MKAFITPIHGSKTGSAIVAVMGVVVLISVVGGSMIANGRQQVYASYRLRDYAKAQVIAESGVNDAYNLIKTNFAACRDAGNFPLKSFGDGTYDVQVNMITSDSCALISTGVCGKASAVVRVDCRNIPLITTNGPSSTNGVSPYSYAMLAGQSLDWDGNTDVKMSNGWLHCNGNYSANGANRVYGNVEASGTIRLVGGATIVGTSKPNAPLVPIPNIDLTPYYNEARKYSQVYTGDRYLSGTVTPPGGIMWVDGDLYLDNGTYNGCFIATGDVILKTTGSSGTIINNRVNQYPTLVSRDGYIQVKQTKNWQFNGLIYIPTGSFDKQGNGDVIGMGSIIAAGNISKDGGWSGLFYMDSTPVPPGGGVVTQDRVVITAWQN